ncbi:MAG TPA: hypothetical protein VLU25_18495, partial [Acidobacteriota bacterium]|nr:hypothetical protein [Acidobacteriota bacterium]
MKRVLVLAFLAGALTLTALASSYVMVSDSDLASRSSAVVIGQVLQAQGVMQDGIPWTRYTLGVEESLRGRLSGRIEVDVPGGIVGDVGLKLYGMPSFAQGEKVLLFLSGRDGSSMRLTHQMLGAFSLYDTPNGEVALRHLEGAVEMQLPRLGQRGRYHRPRNVEAFSRWLKSESRPAEDYFVDLSRQEAEEIGRQRELRQRFTLLECRD